jgi:hypothetical protein
VNYFITFGCYGSHLHGDASGSVNREHNVFGSRLVDEQPALAAVEREIMDQAPYLLDHDRRLIVLDAIRQVCIHRGWILKAAHIRTNHVHVIVQAAIRPERVMIDFKSYASRNLNALGLDEPKRNRWARHGSTRYCGKMTTFEKRLRT